MKILLIYPKTPPTFWNFQEALKFVAKRSSEPPLGLLTVAALLPPEWEKRLIDLNVAKLREEEIRWADYVFLGGMNVHRSSFREVVQRCHAQGVKVVAGGPLATTEYADFPEVDYFVLNEAEITLPLFIEDLVSGEPRRIYSSSEFPDLTGTPAPMWELLDLRYYASLSVQYSRGCPFDCEFCGIAFLNGRKVRTKSAEQFVAEVDGLYSTGWRSSVFIVDDNFIGNKAKLKREVLPALTRWQVEHGYPFGFTTEVSINLADDTELMVQLVNAGFEHVFVGIETVNDTSLAECGKTQNRKRDILASVKKLQSNGLVVSGGFIVGFDNDPADIFEQQSAFIRDSGIAVAMVGLLNAPTGTRLFDRLRSEKRLRTYMSGDNMDGSLNFTPVLDEGLLRAGYRQLVQAIYSPSVYFDRLTTFFRHYRAPKRRPASLNASQVGAFFKSLWILGVVDEGRRYFWKLLFTRLLRYPSTLAMAITMAVYGYHFRKIAESI
ncbi:MAG TPA: B12-binding domain-containing radical SAM protein [Spirochaetia bacterium]|nr:B12-binding domain-containing radical SAM protein [Spirochaetia bacterium]